MSRNDDEVGSFGKALREKLSELSVRDRKPVFVALLDEHLPEDQGVVLVGGCMVEVLTSGAYTTGDIDLIGPSDHVHTLLDEAGFESEGRHFVHPELGLTVELVGPDLDSDQTRTMLEYKGYDVPTVTLEDVIIDRLNAYKHWNSPTDWEQAILVYKTHEHRVDAERLQEKARVNLVEDVLEELQGA